MSWLHLLLLTFSITPDRGRLEGDIDRWEFKQTSKTEVFRGNVFVPQVTLVGNGVLSTSGGVTLNSEFRTKRILLVGSWRSWTNLSRVKFPLSQGFYQHKKEREKDMYRESFPCPTSAVRLVSSQKVDGAHEKYLARLVTGTPVPHTPTHSQYPPTSKHSQSWATYYVISS